MADPWSSPTIVADIARPVKLSRRRRIPRGSLRSAACLVSADLALDESSWSARRPWLEPGSFNEPGDDSRRRPSRSRAAQTPGHRWSAHGPRCELSPEPDSRTQERHRHQTNAGLNCLRPKGSRSHGGCRGCRRQLAGVRTSRREPAGRSTGPLALCSRSPKGPRS